MLLKKLGLISIFTMLVISLSSVGCQQTAPPEEGRQEAAAPQEVSPAPPSTQPPATMTSQEEKQVENEEEVVVARVNDEEIYRSDLIRHMHSMMRNQNPSSPQMALQQLIALELLVQEAEEAGLTAPATEVQQSYQKMAMQAGGQTALEQRITQAGLSKDEVMQQLQRELSHRNVVEDKMAALPEIPAASLETIYEENPEAFERVKARHILVSFDQDATEADKAEALKKMESAVERLEAGEDFAEVAEEVSDDPGSAARGGDLGYFGRGRMVPPFEKAAFNLEPGETSDIVESQFGYHVIKVEDKKKLSLEEVEEGLRDLLGERRRNAVIGEWVTELRDAAEIEIVTSALQLPSMPGMNPSQMRGMAPPPGN